MARIGRLRWKMLALMLAGTVVIYVDRNVLGVLAPILKKERSTSPPSNIPTSSRRFRSSIPSPSRSPAISPT